MILFNFFYQTGAPLCQRAGLQGLKEIILNISIVQQVFIKNATFKKPKVTPFQKVLLLKIKNQFICSSTGRRVGFLFYLLKS
jgi:hypothetical protein